MSTYSLLTPEAAAALSWTAVRLPDPAFESLRAETEAALADIFARHGVTPGVIDGFRVKRIVADRAPLGKK